jgi:bifunctional DNA-binding transcriptional regulator/antitoxin component of YhaV-PrlF toxin-antitoxin module
MLAKLTGKNQITIPKEVLSRIPDAKYFDVHYEKGAVVLKPVKVYKTNLEEIREKIKKLGLTENSVRDALQWARSK